MKSSKVLKLCILFSGNGTNAINLIQTLHNKSFASKNKNDKYRIEVVRGICNNERAKGIEKIRALGILVDVLPHAGLIREEYDTRLVAHINRFAPNLCILSGFMRILSPIFTSSLKAINIHPSFLPLHKGAHAIADSYADKLDFGGVSVHWVDEVLDGGEIILQEKLNKIAGESLEEYEARIHTLEYELFPRAVLCALNLQD